MRKCFVALIVVAVMAALAMPAWADGVRRYGRGSPPAVGAITRNVITPWYVGYYSSYYSYYRPDRMPAPIYHGYEFSCWRWGYWGC